MKSGDILIWHCDDHIRLERLLDAVKKRERAWRLYEFHQTEYLEELRSECINTNNTDSFHLADDRD